MQRVRNPRVRDWTLCKGKGMNLMVAFINPNERVVQACAPARSFPTAG